jgi:hypothetical protein
VSSVEVSFQQRPEGFRSKLSFGNRPMQSSVRSPAPVHPKWQPAFSDL